MRILSRYLIKQHVPPFLFSLAALTGFMLLNQIARRLPMLVGKGLPWTVIVEFFALTIPFIIAMTLSMSVLIAVLHTFSRLGQDSEIVAMRAGGISLGQLLRPVLIAASLVAIVALLFGDQVLPRTNHRLRTLMSAIVRTKPTFSLKEHVINEVQRGNVFLRAAQIEPSTYVMRDVTIYKIGERNSTRIVYADSGQIAFAPNQEDLQVSLYNGTVHDFDRKDPGLFQLSTCERYKIKMTGVGSEFVRRQGDTFHSDRELGICDLENVVRTARRESWRARQLAQTTEQNGLRALVGLPSIEADTVIPTLKRSLYCRLLGIILPAELEAQPVSWQDNLQDSARTEPRIRFNPSARSQVSSVLNTRSRMNETRIQRDRARGAETRAAVYAVEFHKKYAIPAACVIFVLVGVPVALRFPTGGLGMVIGVGMVIFAVYYVGLIAGESLANRMTISPFVAMWTPNMVFGVLGLLGLWRIGRQGIGSRGGERLFRWRGSRRIPSET